MRESSFLKVMIDMELCEKSEKIFLALLCAIGAHAEAGRERFLQLDLTEGQTKVLYILKGNEGILQKDLAELCKISQPTLTVLLEKMIKRDLVRKEVCSVSGGKRGYQIFFTESGRQKAEELEQIVEELEKQSVKGMSSEEVDALLTLSAKVEQNMLL